MNHSESELIDLLTVFDPIDYGRGWQTQFKLQ